MPYKHVELHLLIYSSPSCHQEQLWPRRPELNLLASQAPDIFDRLSHRQEGNYKKTIYTLVQKREVSDFT